MTKYQHSIQLAQKPGEVKEGGGAHSVSVQDDDGTLFPDDERALPEAVRALEKKKCIASLLAKEDLEKDMVNLRIVWLSSRLPRSQSWSQDGCRYWRCSSSNSSDGRTPSWARQRWKQVDNKAFSQKIVRTRES